MTCHSSACLRLDLRLILHRQFRNRSLVLTSVEPVMNQVPVLVHLVPGYLTAAIDSSRRHVNALLRDDQGSHRLIQHDDGLGGTTSTRMQWQMIDNTG